MPVKKIQNADLSSLDQKNQSQKEKFAHQTLLTKEEQALVAGYRVDKRKKRPGKRPKLPDDVQLKLIEMCEVNENCSTLTSEQRTKLIAKYRNKAQQIHKQRKEVLGTVITEQIIYHPDLPGVDYGIVAIYHNKTSKVYTASYVTIQDTFDTNKYFYTDNNSDEALRLAQNDYDSVTKNRYAITHNFLGFDQYCGKVKDLAKNCNFHNLKKLSLNKLAFILASYYIDNISYRCKTDQSIFNVLYHQIGHFKFENEIQDYKYDELLTEMLESLLKSDCGKYNIEKYIKKKISFLKKSFNYMHIHYSSETKVFEQLSNALDRNVEKVLARNKSNLTKPSNYQALRLAQIKIILDHMYSLGEKYYFNTLLQLMIGLRHTEFDRLNSEFLLDNNVLNYEQKNKSGQYLIQKTIEKVNPLDLRNPRVDLLAAIILRNFDFRVPKNVLDEIWDKKNELRQKLENELLQSGYSGKVPHRRSLRTTCATMLMYSTETLLCAKVWPGDVQNRLAHRDLTMITKVYAKNKPQDYNGRAVDSYFSIQPTEVTYDGESILLNDTENAWAIFLTYDFLIRFSEKNSEYKKLIIDEIKRLKLINRIEVKKITF